MIVRNKGTSGTDSKVNTQVQQSIKKGLDFLFDDDIDMGDFGNDALDEDEDDNDNEVMIEKDLDNWI